MIGKLKEFLQKNGLANKTMTDYEFCTIVFSLFSLAATIVSAVVVKRQSYQ